MKKRMKFKNKRAQGSVMGMPFSTIFSIILIVFFIVIAFVAIKYFLSIGKCGQIGVFSENLQEEIDKAWNSESYDNSGNQFTANLPSGIEYVCFADFKKPATSGSIEQKVYKEFTGYEVYDDNLFLYPRKKACEMERFKINHIDLEKIISVKNPYCIVADGKVKITIKKGFNENLVSLS